jgi:hypothetical protein
MLRVAEDTASLGLLERARAGLDCDFVNIFLKKTYETCLQLLGVPRLNWHRVCKGL